MKTKEIIEKQKELITILLSRELKREGSYDITIRNLDDAIALLESAEKESQYNAIYEKVKEANTPDKRTFEEANFIQTRELTDEEWLKLPKEEILKLYKNCYSMLMQYIKQPLDRYGYPLTSANNKVDFQPSNPEPDKMTDRKIAIEILNKYDIDFGSEADREYYTNEVLKAMQEYASQSRPLQMPSEEEIEKEALNYEKEYQKSFGANSLGAIYTNEDFIAGVNWFKSRIQVQPEITVDKVLKTIDDEPELPGKMPEIIWEAVKNDRDAFEELLRTTVRLTKEGIRNRLKRELK